MICFSSNKIKMFHYNKRHLISSSKTRLLSLLVIQNQSATNSQKTHLWNNPEKFCFVITVAMEPQFVKALHMIRGVAVVVGIGVVHPGVVVPHRLLWLRVGVSRHERVSLAGEGLRLLVRDPFLPAFLVTGGPVGGGPTRSRGPIRGSGWPRRRLVGPSDRWQFRRWQLKWPEWLPNRSKK